MIIKLYQVDAFTDVPFGGNPAAICPLNSWISDGLMQKIANENNLSETAFFVPKNNTYELRWFTPKVEVDLCGHATLGAAYVIFKHINSSTNEITFKSRSGTLIVSRKDEYLTLDFPAIAYTECNSNHLRKIFHSESIEAYKGVDYMVVLKNEEEVKSFSPDFNLIEQLDSRGLIITAQGNKAEFVSRWFGPQVGVPEDPVTGSAHCMLAPYWANRLNKSKLYAEQLSTRLGKIYCETKGDRVLLSGQVMPFLNGQIEI